MKKLPKVSIIISSYTMERFQDITELLDSIHEQTYDDIEVIVVTERSQELTESIQSYIQEKGYSRVEVLFNQGEQGVSPARNLGIRHATGEIIAFADDDAILFPDWAEKTVIAYGGVSSIGGLTGPILPLWEDESMNWFPREFYWIFSCTYWDWTEPTEVRNGYGTNMSFRRDVFDKCGLFKTSLGVKGYGKGGWQGLGGEEVEFSLRVKTQTGKRVVYDPGIRVKHKVFSYRFKNRFIRRRAYWEGQAKAMFKSQYYSGNKQVLSTEHELLRRILFRLVPGSIKLFFSKPYTALRRLRVTVLVLASVATGYFSYKLLNLLDNKK